VAKRQRDGLSSVLDEFRSLRVEEAMQIGSELRSAAFMDVLWAICGVCCLEAATAPTFGVIQDVLDYVARSSTSVARSLSDQIAHKIVPQLGICQ
jgi:hypothetical protein